MITRTIPCKNCGEPVTFPVLPGPLGGMYATEAEHESCDEEEPKDD